MSSTGCYLYEKRKDGNGQGTRIQGFWEGLNCINPCRLWSNGSIWRWFPKGSGEGLKKILDLQVIIMPKVLDLRLSVVNPPGSLLARLQCGGYIPSNLSSAVLVTLREMIWHVCSAVPAGSSDSEPVEGERARDDFLILKILLILSNYLFIFMKGDVYERS